MLITKTVDVDTSAPVDDALFQLVDLSPTIGSEPSVALEVADSFEFVAPSDFDAGDLIIPNIDLMLGGDGASLSTSIAAGVGDSGVTFASVEIDAVGSIDATIGIGTDFGMIDLMMF